MRKWVLSGCCIALIFACSGNTGTDCASGTCTSAYEARGEGSVGESVPPGDPSVAEDVLIQPGSIGDATGATPEIETDGLPTTIEAPPPVEI